MQRGLEEPNGRAVRFFRFVIPDSLLGLLKWRFRHIKSDGRRVVSESVEPIDHATEYERLVALAGFSARTKQRMNEYLPISTHSGTRHIRDLVGAVDPLSGRQTATFSASP